MLNPSAMPSPKAHEHVNLITFCYISDNTTLLCSIALRSFRIFKLCTIRRLGREQTQYVVVMQMTMLFWPWRGHFALSVIYLLFLTKLHSMYILSFILFYACACARFILISAHTPTLRTRCTLMQMQNLFDSPIVQQNYTQLLLCSSPAKLEMRRPDIQSCCQWRWHGATATASHIRFCPRKKSVRTFFVQTSSLCPKTFCDVVSVFCYTK